MAIQFKEDPKLVDAENRMRMQMVAANIPTALTDDIEIKKGDPKDPLGLRSGI